MRVDLMRTRLRAATMRGSSSFDDADLDYALQMALQDLDLQARVQRCVGTVTLTVGDPQVDTSAIEGLRPDRVVRCELGYVDRGVWSSTMGALNVNDLVQGNGTPDSYFYVCGTAHTADATNGPGMAGGASLWSMRPSKRGPVVEILTDPTLMRLYGNGEGGGALDPNNPYVRSTVIERGQPQFIAWRDQCTAFVMPVPLTSWQLNIIQDSEVADWNPGEENPDINLPRNVLYPLIDVGAAHYLEPTTSEGVERGARWETMKVQIRGRLIIDRGMAIKDPGAYMDHTDRRNYGRQGYRYR